MGLAAPVDLSTATWSFACPDWAERLAAGRSLVPDLPLDQVKAEKAVRIFNKLRVPDIVGQPPFAEAAGEWFRDIVRVILGSLDDDGVRHVPAIFALIGKKNSKTTNGGGLMLTALLVNEVPRGELLFIGPTQEIADLAFQQAVGMIDADPDGYLQKRFHVIDHKKTIRDRVTKAFVKVKTFDMKVMTGSKPIGVLIDELHIMGTIHYAARVLGQIRGALESKKNSFLLIISTQSDQPPAGVFKAELSYARSVRDGKVPDARMLPILYEFPAKMQADPAKPWANPAHWPMVMPNLGRSLHLDTMIAGYNAAKVKGEEEERRWASQHLNIEIGLALSADGWRGADYWEAQADRTLTLDELIARSEVATIGIDGGGLDDLLGLSVIGREKVTRRWLIWNHAFAHPKVLELRKDIAANLHDFEDEGSLTFAEVPDDVGQLVDIIFRVFQAGLLPEKNAIGIDPNNIATIIEALALAGIPDAMLMRLRQGPALAPALWGLERKLSDGTAVHSGLALMAWCVGNVKVEVKGNSSMATKQAAGRAKIDPVIALFCAAILMSWNPSAKGPSVYTKRRMRVA